MPLDHAKADALRDALRAAPVEAFVAIREARVLSTWTQRGTRDDVWEHPRARVWTEPSGRVLFHVVPDRFLEDPVAVEVASVEEGRAAVDAILRERGWVTP